MSAQASRLALVKSRVAAAALLSVLLVSCSSTSDSTLDVATPAFTDDPAQTAAAAEIDKAEGSAPATKLTKSATHAVANPETNAETKPAETKQAAASDASEAKVDKQAEAALAASVAPESQPIDPKKKNFLSSFFGSETKATAATPVPVRQEAAKPLVKLASTEQPKAKAILDLDDQDSGGNFLPGVRSEGLFEIKRKAGGMSDNGDIDIHEDEEGPPVLLASAAGLARLAPNGLLKQRESVDVACLKPGLVGILKTVERHFGKKLIVTSGFRSPAYNRKVNGAKRSQHMYCAAADVQVPGVSKWELAKYVRSMPGRGGVGTYCHTASVHIDIGPERDWNWRCRRRT